MKQFFVYILASKTCGTLYVGVTNDLLRRVYEHKHNMIPGFTQKYGVHKLVYYEVHEDVKQAITREKQIKRWKRQWKLNLIDKHNPSWKDLYHDIVPDNGLLPSQE